MRTLPFLLLLSCDGSDSCKPGFSLNTEGLCEVDDADPEFDALLQRVDELEAAVDALTNRFDNHGGGSLGCPSDMVQVGDFCMDTYKASVWSDEACSDAQYGIDLDDYPAGFPDSGDWVVPAYACSISDVVPSGNLTWFQAAQACTLSGKSLCTNAQWQSAAAGIPSDASLCGLLEDVPTKTGSYPDCVSSWGTVDQVGIRWEWTADWTPGGPIAMTAEDGHNFHQYPWPFDYGDGGDYTLNFNGTAMGHDGEILGGLPSAVIRGGDYGNGESGGKFSLSVARGPSHMAPFIGFRCCSGL